MTLLPNYMQELDFEEWLDCNTFIERITDANIAHFAAILSSEIDIDSYAVSATYYAYTGRRGLWLYQHEETYIPLCWHPNIAGQILIFPPRGKKNYSLIKDFMEKAPTPPQGFLLARFKPEEISQIQTVHAAEPIEENVLDWRYPSRILSTLKTSQMIGHEYMLIRNRVRQTSKYKVEVHPISMQYTAQIEELALRWANRQAENPGELIDLVTPYKETLRLLKHRPLGLDGLVVFVDGKIEAATIWDTSNAAHKIANLYMNLVNVSYRGLSEFLIKAAAMKLCAAGIPLLNLGGSETASLDHYKNKFVPVLSVNLCSLEPHTQKTSIPAEVSHPEKELKVA